MELKDILPMKIAMALRRSGIVSIQELMEIFNQDASRIRKVRGIGESGYHLIEYILKVESA